MRTESIEIIPQLSELDHLHQDHIREIGNDYRNDEKHKAALVCYSVALPKYLAPIPPSLAYSSQLSDLYLGKILSELALVQSQNVLDTASQAYETITKMLATSLQIEDGCFGALSTEEQASHLEHLQNGEIPSPTLYDKLKEILAQQKQPLYTMTHLYRKQLSLTLYLSDITVHLVNTLFFYSELPDKNTKVIQILEDTIASLETMHSKKEVRTLFLTGHSSKAFDKEMHEAQLLEYKAMFEGFLTTLYLPASEKKEVKLLKLRALSSVGDFSRSSPSAPQPSQNTFPCR